MPTINQRNAGRTMQTGVLIEQAMLKLEEAYRLTTDEGQATLLNVAIATIITAQKKEVKG